MKKISLLLLISLFVTFLAPVVTTANESLVNLETADSFAILAGSGITNTGTTVIDGDVGLDPGTSFTGEAAAVINGEVHIDDAVALQAKDDLLIAYNDAAGRSGNTIPSELGGSTITPGVYNSDTSLQITGTLTLDGQNDPNAVFIFQAGSTLTTATASNIELINGAKSNNIFWQVGTSATLGTNSTFEGNILASESITATTGADIEGRLLALNGAVTLDTNTVTIEEAGSLTVTKEVIGDVSGTTVPTFEVTVTGPEGFSATRTFDDGEAYTWENLVPGTYNVTESRTGLTSDWTVSGEGDIAVVADETSSTTITNTYTATTAPTPVGSLTVGKTVVGDVGTMTLPTFEMTVTGPEGFSATRTFVEDETYTWDNLVPGTYNVTESSIGLSSEWVVSGEGDVTVVADEIASTTVTNTYTATTAPTPVGSLTVGKTVAGDVGTMTLPTFEMTVTGPEGFSATRTFVEGETYTWQNLVPGTYNVTESRTGLSSEWVVSGEGTIDVVADEESLATITNTYTATVEPEVGSLTIGKIVAGDIGDMTLPLYEVTITGPRGFSADRTFVHGKTYTWNNLTPGEYNITESRTGLSSEWVVSGEGSISVIEDELSSVTITNTYTATPTPVVGSLTIDKTVTGDVGDMTLPLFDITVTGPEGFLATRTFVKGEAYTWENLVPGTYNITESRAGLSSEWVVNGEGNVTVVADEVSASTIANTYTATVEPEVGALTVEKNVVGDAGDMTLPLFEITVIGPEDFSATRTFVDGETYTWENLVPGTYDVTENRTGMSSEWTITGEKSVEIMADQLEIITVTNSYEEIEEIPQTGTNSDYNEGILFGSIATVMAGLGILIGYKKKKSNE